MDECGDLLRRLQSQKRGEDTRRGRDVADPKTQSTDLDTLTADEPWDQRDPGSLERLSLPQFRVGLLTQMCIEKTVEPASKPLPSGSSLSFAGEMGYDLK